MSGQVMNGQRMNGQRGDAFDIVIPTVGRPSLLALLDALADQDSPVTGRVICVDDRRQPATPLLPGVGVVSGAGVGLDVAVVTGGGAGPAAARNVGWRQATASWVAFLDDDVLPGRGWSEDLARDLAACGPAVAATQGRICVPLPADRRPSDWERNVAGLESAAWATADMAYRRSALLRLGGFDERFPRAYREDADLALRSIAAGYELVVGARRVDHPVSAAPWHASIDKQAGNADDAMMARLHGPRWREQAQAPAGAFTRHAAVVAALVTAIALAAPRYRRRSRRASVGRAGVAKTAAGVWIGGTVSFAWRRIAPGPRTPAEVATMVVTSVAIPPAAVWHRVKGVVAARRVHPRPAPPEAVLFDRDGTLVVDVAYNGDPTLVEPVPGARQALDRLREAGLPVALVSNQSGVARGLLTCDQVAAVNRRVAELLGPFDAMLVCPHGPADGCECRKPRPGMVTKAAAELGVRVERCAVVGDIAADVGAALAAGARPILVPNEATRPEEVAAAPEVASDLAGAVDLLLGAR